MNKNACSPILPSVHTEGQYDESGLILYRITFYLYRQKHFSAFPCGDRGFLTVSLSHCFTLGRFIPYFLLRRTVFCIIIQTKWLCNVAQLLLLRFNSNTAMWQLQLYAPGGWRAVLLSTPRAHKSSPANCSHLGVDDPEVRLRAQPIFTLSLIWAKGNFLGKKTNKTKKR